MNHRIHLGKQGENIACQHLIERGYQIIERNYRRPWGEIDIIAKAPDKTLVFVEVKTLWQDKPTENALQPENQLTRSKLQKLQRTASLYVGRYPEKINKEKNWRIDLLALTITPKNHLINHYENI